jgi:sulfur carrier protein ThiS
MIRVNDREVEFKRGITVADAIKSSGWPTGEGIIVMVDGKVLSKEDLSQEAGRESNIKVMILVSGG